MESNISLEFTEENLKNMILKWYFKETDIDYDKFEGFWYVNNEGENSFKVVGML